MGDQATCADHSGSRGAFGGAAILLSRAMRAVAAAAWVPLVLATPLSAEDSQASREIANLVKDEFPIWPAVAPGSEDWTQKELYDKHWRAGFKVIRNVVRPTLVPRLPDPAKSNGVAVIVVPGSKMVSIPIELEGLDVANALAAEGYTAFVLKYRVIPSGTTAEDFKAALDTVLDASAPGAAIDGGYTDKTRYIVPLATDDLRQAVTVVRRGAAKWKIDPGKIGVIGFSSGVQLVNGLVAKNSAESQPDFAAVVHGYTVDWNTLPAKLPPLFIACAFDDKSMPATNCSDIYEAWYSKNQPAELHIYSAGGHDFNFNPSSLPANQWFDRYTDWLATLFKQSD